MVSLWSWKGGVASELVVASHSENSARIQDTIADREEGLRLTMAFSAKALISLMARGARFLKETPWTYIRKIRNQSSVRYQLMLESGH